MNWSDRRMSVSHPAGRFRRDWMPHQRVVVLHDRAGFAPGHVDFVIRQHRLEGRVDDEERHSFGGQPFNSFGPQFVRSCATAD